MNCRLGKCNQVQLPWNRGYDMATELELEHIEFDSLIQRRFNLSRYFFKLEQQLSTIFSVRLHVSNSNIVTCNISLLPHLTYNSELRIHRQSIEVTVDGWLV